MSYADANSGGSSALPLLVVVAFAAFVYFLMIRPQQKRRREVENMQSAMGLGDEVVTVGGLYGTVVEVTDDTVLLEIAPGVTAKYARAAIAKVNKKAAVEEDAADEESDGSDSSKTDGD
ncbi:preprotein translocase subunit YajC [Dactylosporangium sp. NPDC051485]|uniref:preprotein translocase subunit YajC n=1 Tax=Dactylosporangium sp. NPDC051485 TaxID=3154846 RepID=UPI003432C186